MTCNTCRYWEVDPEWPEPHEVGRCHREPPRRVDETTDRLIAGWPRTYCDDWCGEYREAGIVNRSIAGKVERRG